MIRNIMRPFSHVASKLVWIDMEVNPNFVLEVFNVDVEHCSCRVEHVRQSLALLLTYLFATGETIMDHRRYISAATSTQRSLRDFLRKHKVHLCEHQARRHGQLKHYTYTYSLNLFCR